MSDLNTDGEDDSDADAEMDEHDADEGCDEEKVPQGIILSDHSDRKEFQIR